MKETENITADKAKTIIATIMADKAKLALVVVGSILGLELVLIAVLALTKTPIPEQSWSLVYATIGVLSGVAGAQALNGKHKDG